MSPKLRRLAFGGLVLSTIAVLTALMVYSLSFEGMVALEWVLLSCFVITLPWTAIGFWNAVIGFVLLRGTRNPAMRVFPGLANAKPDDAITASTAVAMCVRNEDVDTVRRNLHVLAARLVASGHGNKFHIYILSDSSFEDILAQENIVFPSLVRDWKGRIKITYRRRTSNPGFKAGNIRDFCERWGHAHDYMLTLDADSVMSAGSILRMVRVMQANGNLGILQSLVVGLPSDSAFTRIFQFGMRMGMKSYTIGSAWWQADCGPYWGHNALIRMKPFMEHCHLPPLPGKGPLSGWILSHDQVEAVYMRRAGYECRVLAEEGGSYEENPPHVLEFIRRDLRWCHGNMQYFKLLGESGLKLTSRIQLMLAILMFIGSPAWMLFVLAATAAFVNPELGVKLQAVGPTYLLFGIIMAMIFAPKIASLADTLIDPSLRRSFGGTIAIIVSAFGEIIFSILLAPIMAVANTIFLAKLFLFGKAKAWTAQTRSTQALPLMVTITHLWPQFLFGVAGVTAVMSVENASYAALAICLPVFIGPALVLPFAVFTSHPALGWLAARFGLWQLPEEEHPPVVVRALELPAVKIRAQAEVDRERYAPLTTEQLLKIEPETEKLNEPTQVVV